MPLGTNNTGLSRQWAPHFNIGFNIADKLVFLRDDLFSLGLFVLLELLALPVLPSFSRIAKHVLLSAEIGVF